MLPWDTYMIPCWETLWTCSHVESLMTSTSYHLYQFPPIYIFTISMNFMKALIKTMTFVTMMSFEVFTFKIILGDISFFFFFLNYWELLTIHMWFFDCVSKLFLCHITKKTNLGSCQAPNWIHTKVMQGSEWGLSKGVDLWWLQWPPQRKGG